MIARAVPELKLQARELWMEARELHLIFSRIWRGRKNESTGRKSSARKTNAPHLVRHSSFVIRISSF